MEQPAAPDERIATWWVDYRHLVRDVAYRILGSVADAEDVASEAYLRLLREDPDSIENARAWLVTVASRLSIDRLRAHEHARREYVGPWLPEPLVVDDALTPEDRITLDDSVRMALLVVLERLTPAERTAFILHDVFDLDFRRIAEILGRSPESSRQLASRARRRVHEADATRFATDPAHARALCEGFARACADGDLDALVTVLAPDVHGEFDSGGLVPGARTDGVSGAEEVARRLTGVIGGLPFDYRVVAVNGAPGLVVRRGEAVVAVLSFEFAPDGISVIRGIGNPEKLRHLA